MKQAKVAQQSEKEQRVIAGTAKGKKLLALEGTTRPITSRIKATVFDLLRELLTGANVLDLYAGSGALGIEALSRGANKATFIEMDESAAKLINQNLLSTRLGSRAEIVIGKLPEAALLLEDKNFDIIFCDPPYTNLDDFSIDGYAWLMTAENVFCLRLPSDRKIDQDLQKKLGELNIEILYSKEIGISRVYFLRKQASADIIP